MYLKLCVSFVWLLLSFSPCAGSSGGHDEHVVVLGQRGRDRRLVSLWLQRFRHRRTAHLCPASPAHVSHCIGPHPAHRGRRQITLHGNEAGCHSSPPNVGSLMLRLRPEIYDFDAILSFSPLECHRGSRWRSLTLTAKQSQGCRGDTKHLMWARMIDGGIKWATWPPSRCYS